MDYMICSREAWAAVEHHIARNRSRRRRRSEATVFSASSSPDRVSKEFGLLLAVAILADAWSWR